MRKQYSVRMCVPTLPTHGKTCLELFAANYACTLWTDYPPYAVPFSQKHGKETVEKFQRVDRLDAQLVNYPPKPSQIAVNHA